MSDTFIAGLFGLAGAVIGAATTAWASIAQQRRDARAERSRREEEAERDRKARLEVRRQAATEARDHARTAARLLQADTLQARLRIRAALRKDKYWSDPFALPQQSWISYREQVARYLPLQDWNSVSQWFRSVASVEAQAIAAKSLHEGVRRPTLTAKGKRQLQLAESRADRALLALEAFTEDVTQGVDEEEIDLDLEGDYA